MGWWAHRVPSEGWPWAVVGKLREARLEGGEGCTC